MPAPSTKLALAVAGVGQPEDQQRPVPQVQRVGHGAQCHERARRPAAGWAAGIRPRVCGSACRLAAGQDEQHRGADRHQRPRPGELLDAVDQRAAGQDRRQRHHGDHGAQPHRPADVRHQRADQRAEQQLPGAREAVVVRGGLVGVVGEDRVDERRDGQRAEQHDERDPHVLAAAGGGTARRSRRSAPGTRCRTGPAPTSTRCAAAD